MVLFRHINIIVIVQKSILILFGVFIFGPKVVLENVRMSETSGSAQNYSTNFDQIHTKHREKKCKLILEMPPTAWYS